MKRLIVGGTACIGAVLFAYAIHAIGLPRIQETVVRIGWGFAAIVLLSGAREAARTLAWMRAIEGPAQLPFLEAFRARLAGEALSTLLPMGILVGEPAKAEHVGDRLPFATAFGALAIELAFYGASLLLLFSAGVLALFPFSTTLLLAAAPLVALPHVARKLLMIGEPVLGFASRHPARAWSVISLEIAFHALAIAEGYVTLTLISPHRVAWTSALVLETVSRAVTLIFKVLPMRMGVDEAGAAMFANRLDLGATTGIMLALVRKIRLLFWSAVGLAILLMRSARMSRTGALSALSLGETRS